MHTSNVSTEPLEIIFANECRDEPALASTRFRRLQNEIERLRSAIEAAYDAETHEAAMGILHNAMHGR